MAAADKIYKVRSGDFEFSFTQAEIEAADLIKRSPKEFNLIHHHCSVNAKLLEENATAKQQQIEVEGENFDVKIMDELDQVLEKMGFDKVATKQIKEIKAPMPGMVLEIAVSEGQEVVEGEKVLILGAMKMENGILVHANAIIKKIHIVTGQAVEKGQVLVELE